MTLDGLDHAFLAQWQAIASQAATAAPPSPEPPAPVAAAVEPEAAVPGIVGRLLASAPAEWSGLADEIEAARTRGRRSIAVTAAERGVGCSTVIAVLTHVLRGRGRDVVACAGVAGSADPALAGPAHDKRIVLVDAGVWFPSGPIRRQRLIATSIGCDAAILVRPADSEPVPSWAVALEAIGVEPLGEIISFAAPTGPEVAA